MVNMDALLTDNTTVWSKMSRWVLILKNSQLKKSSHTTWILLLHLAIISYLHISKVISSSIFLTSFPSYMGQYMKKLPSLTYSHNNRFYLFIFFFYLGFVSPCNIIHSNKSNQHVSGMPKTCWAVFKWWAINLRDWCIWLVDLFECMMMHGLTNPTFINAKQAGDKYAYRNIKQKLHKTIAAIWFNKLPPRSNVGKPKVATAVYKLLMMGKRMPETCWAVFKRWAINLRDW